MENACVATRSTGIAMKERRVAHPSAGEYENSESPVFSHPSVNHSIPRKVGPETGPCSEGIHKNGSSRRPSLARNVTLLYRARKIGSWRRETRQPARGFVSLSS